MSERRTFTLEFKLEAVKLVTEKGLSSQQVADDLGVNVNNIRRWKKEYGKRSLENVSEVSSEMKEIRRLQDEVRQLKIERDILKKATAIFVKGNQ
jgi:transposase